MTSQRRNRRLVRIAVSALTIWWTGSAVAQTSVLLIASSNYAGAGPYVSYIEPPLTAAGYDVRVWSQATEGWPPIDTLLAHDVVFFHGGERKRTGDIDSILTEFALAGGRLVSEGSILPRYGSVYHDFSRHVIHSKWLGECVTQTTHVVADSLHPIASGLPGQFAASGYYSWIFPDHITADRGGHCVIRFQEDSAAAAVVAHPRTVFICGSLRRIVSSAARDSLIVNTVCWVQQDPYDASVTHVDYELGHWAGETIPVDVGIRNWAPDSSSGRLILEASTDSIVWTRIDSSDYVLPEFGQDTMSFTWTPTQEILYYLRGLIEPTTTDIQSENNHLDIMVTTLQEPLHPKLFFRVEDIPELQHRAATTHADFAQALREFVDETIGIYLPPPEQWATVNFLNLGIQVGDAAIQAILDPSPTYIDHAKRLLLTLCRYPHWETGFVDMDSHAGLCCQMGVLAYDWLYHELSKAERDTVQLKLRTQLERLDAAHPKLIWWARTYMHAHHWSNLGYLGTASLGLLEEEPAATRIHERAMSSLDNRMYFFGSVEDGSWYEGMNYWGSNSWKTLPHLYLLREQLGIDYFSYPFFQGRAKFRLYGSLPYVDYMVAMNESQPSEWYGPEAQLALLAHEYNDGEAQWIMRRVLEARNHWDLDGPFYLFWYDPSIPEVPPTQLSYLVPDQDVYFARSDWSHRATFVSLKCGLPCGRSAYTTYWSPGGQRGDFAHSHFHPDQNDFTVFCRGKYLIENAGIQYPVHRTRNSSTILINGHGQIGDSTKGVWPLPADELSMNPHLAEAYGTPGLDYVIGDATTAYMEQDGLTLFHRHLLYIRPDMIVILDRLKATQPATFSFLLRHFQPVFSWDSQRVLITDDDVQMTMRVLEPGDWTAQTYFNWLYYDDWGGWALQLDNAVSDTSIRFLNVLYPADDGHEAQVERLASNEDYAAVRLTDYNGWEATAMIKHSDLDQVDIDLLETNAELTVVVRDTVQDQLLQVTVKAASYLKWGAESPLSEEAVTRPRQTREPRYLFVCPDTTDMEWDYRGDTLAISGQALPLTRLWAPDAAVILLDGQEIDYARDGDYVFLLTNEVPPDRVVDLTVVWTVEGPLLRWTPVPMIFGDDITYTTGHDIYRAVGGRVEFELLAQVGAGDSTFLDTEFPPGEWTTTSYRVVIRHGPELATPVPEGEPVLHRAKRPEPDTRRKVK